jgi:hypothetical protein
MAARIRALQAGHGDAERQRLPLQRRFRARYGAFVLKQAGA